MWGSQLCRYKGCISFNQTDSEGKEYCGILPYFSSPIYMSHTENAGCVAVATCVDSRCQS